MIASLQILLPEIFLSGVALFLFGMDTFISRRLKAWTIFISLAALFLALFVVIWSPWSGRVFGMVVSDVFSSFFKILAITSSILIFLLSEDDPELMGPHAGTYAGLIILSTVGIMFLSGTEDLLILFLGLELTTVPLFILAGFLRKEERSSESAIKFFLVGVFSTGLMIYGISFLYGLCGGTHFSDLQQWITTNRSENLTLFLIGIFFLLAGLGFKFSLVPFHQWTPDTYQGAPTPITAFFSISRDAGVLVIFLRLFGHFIPKSPLNLTGFFMVISVLTMTIGNLTALRQTNLKRLLAYSSIAHAGTIFIGVVAGNALGREGAMIYSIAYSMMSLGAFAVVIAVSRIKGNDELNAVQGLAQENLGLALLMLFFLMSLAGIPPFLGFLGKFYVFLAAVNEKMYGLVAIGLLNSVIAVYYYFRIVHKMFFMSPEETRPSPNRQFSVQTVAWFAASVLLIFGTFPEPILFWAKSASQILP